MIRVGIVDDHPVVRQGIKQIVAATDDVSVVFEATTGRELTEALETAPCDVLLLDLSLPDIDGLELLKQLRRGKTALPVLVLTMHSEEQFAIRTLRAGANGYLTKDSAPAELVGAIRKVMSGSRYMTPQLAERIAAHLGPENDRPLHERLSDREYQVMRMIAHGKATREIASELGLSIKTVSTYRARLLEKMEMRSTAEITAYDVRHHLD
jgi:two-component system, NarL family, invasion response regulator UvrY